MESGFRFPGSSSAAARGGVGSPTQAGGLAGGDGFAVYVTVRMWRGFSPKTLEKAMSSAWAPLGRMVMTLVEDNLFLFRFDHRPDFAKVLREGPWRFNDHPLAIQEAKFGQKVDRLRLVMVPYWIQVYNVPPFYQTEEFMKYVGSRISKEVIAVDATVRRQPGIPKPFMRVRVAINTALRIPRGTSVWFGEEEVPMAFKYERLHNFCSLCGLVDHVMEDCEAPIMDDVDVNNPPYGDWLRGIPPRIPAWQQQGARVGAERPAGNPFMVPASTSRRIGSGSLTPVPRIKDWQGPSKVTHPPGFESKMFDPGMHPPKKTYQRHARALEDNTGQKLKKIAAEDLETTPGEEEGGGNPFRFQG